VGTWGGGAVEGQVGIALPYFEIVWAEWRYYIWRHIVALTSQPWWKWVIDLLSKESQVVFTEGSEVGFDRLEPSIIGRLILDFDL
jgi:hypothetical protein